MITQAITFLINTPAITSLVSTRYYPGVAAQNATFPYLVWNERARTENFKNGSKISLYDLQIDIYASQGKDGNDGFSDVNDIRAAVVSTLDRYSGIAGGYATIQQIYLDSEEVLYDPISEAVRCILSFVVRVDTT